VGEEGWGRKRERGRRWRTGGSDGRGRRRSSRADGRARRAASEKQGGEMRGSRSGGGVEGGLPDAAEELATRSAELCGAAGKPARRGGGFTPREARGKPGRGAKASACSGKARTQRGYPRYAGCAIRAKRGPSRVARKRAKRGSGFTPRAARKPRAARWWGRDGQAGASLPPRRSARTIRRNHRHTGQANHRRPQQGQATGQNPTRARPQQERQSPKPKAQQDQQRPSAPRDQA
jgi:hypothetical protein